MARFARWASTHFLGSFLVAFSNMGTQPNILKTCPGCTILCIPHKCLGPYQFSTKIPEPVFFFLFPLGNPHTKPRRFFPKNCPGHPPKQPTTQQSFFHLRLPGPTASATLTVGSCKHLGQDIHTHAERWALWPGLKRADRDWGAEDIFPAPPLPGTHGC